MKVKIGLISDAHLEFGDLSFDNDQNADVLILAGDILVAKDLKDFARDDAVIPLQQWSNRYQRVLAYRKFLEECSSKFKHVLWVAGNHEFYHGKWFETLDILKHEAEYFPNITFMENSTVDIDGYKFIGASMWTDANKQDPLTKIHVEAVLNDYRIIKNEKEGYRRLSISDSLQRHLASMRYFSEQWDKFKHDKVIMVTHHAPTFQSISPDYVGETLTNGGYASDLSNEILNNPQIKLWVHGHVHAKNDYIVGNCRVVSNPRGYIGHEVIAEQWQLQYYEVI
jgi:Icc-related predicted phosphoesterase